MSDTFLVRRQRLSWNDTHTSCLTVKLEYRTKTRAPTTHNGEKGRASWGQRPANRLQYSRGAITKYRPALKTDTYFEKDREMATCIMITMKEEDELEHAT